MPYGYEKFRLDNGISPNTVVHEVQLIRSLFPNDFMPKFKFSEKLDLTPSDIYLDYEDLLKKKDAVLEADHLSLNAKILYILYLRGLRLRDMVAIDVDNFDDRDGKLVLAVEKKDGYQCRLEFSEKEIPVMLDGIERAVFRGTPYLLSSKVRNEYTMFQMGSLSDYTEALSSFVGMPMRSGDIRFAYVHYLYSVEHKNLEEIQEILGVSLDSASRILKDSLVRLKRGSH